MNNLVFAAVIFVVSLGVDCGRIHLKKELHSRMTRSINQLWTDSTTKATFKEAGEICESKYMRLATPITPIDDDIIELFVHTVCPEVPGQHSYWAFGRYDMQEHPVIYTGSYDEEYIYTYSSENAKTFAQKGGKGNFQDQKALFICEIF